MEDKTYTHKELLKLCIDSFKRGCWNEACAQNGDKYVKTNDPKLLEDWIIKNIINNEI